MSFKTQLKSIQQKTSPDNLRGLFFSNEFYLPRVESSLENPKGYYSLVEKFISKNINTIIDMGDGNYTIPMENKKSKDMIKFFVTMLNDVNLFDQNASAIKNIMLQKTCINDPSKQFLRLEKSESNDIRIVIAIKNQMSPSNIWFKFGPSHKDSNKKSQQIDIFKEESFGTCLSSDLSEMDIYIGESRKNSSTKLPEAFFIIMDITPSSDLSFEIKQRLLAADQRDMKRHMESMLKNFSGNKMMKQFQSLTGGNADIMDKLKNMFAKKEENADHQEEGEVVNAEVQELVSSKFQDDDE